MWPHRLRERNNTTEGGRGGEGREWHRGGGKQLRGRGAAGNAPPRPVRQGVYDGGRFVWLAAVGGQRVAARLLSAALHFGRGAGSGCPLKQSTCKHSQARDEEAVWMWTWVCSARAAAGGARVCNQSTGGSPKWRHPFRWPTLENKQGGMAASCSSHPCAMPGLDLPTQCVHGSTAAWKAKANARREGTTACRGTPTSLCHSLVGAVACNTRVGCSRG